MKKILCDLDEETGNVSSHGYFIGCVGMKGMRYCDLDDAEETIKNGSTMKLIDRGVLPQDIIQLKLNGLL